MLIPSIDLMGGKIVQLVQGEKKALEFDDFDFWIERFSRFPLVQLIDLDAALGRGSNQNLVAMVCKRLPCQVGGGIRTAERGREMIADGARRVIFGSALLKNGKIDREFAEQCSRQLSGDTITFAIDSRRGKVAIKGWKEDTAIDPLAMVRELEGYCSAFLYTHIDNEGTMTGFPRDVAERLRSATTKQMMVAGGIRSTDEVNTLHEMGVDAVVGMAIYTGTLFG